MQNKSLLLTAVLSLSTISLHAANYLVGSNPGGYETVYHQGYAIPAGNVYNSLSTLLSTNIPEGSTIFFQAGTVADDVTINVNGLSLFGYNRNCSSRYNNRQDQETVVTGRWTIDANDVTVNGFKFTGNGQVYNGNTTKATVISGFKFEFNEVVASTLSQALDNGVVAFGAYYKGDAANNTSVFKRYENFEVCNNDFSGDATHTANFITLNGLYGSETKINKNSFYDGGTSISVANSCGNIKIVGNRFDHVGVLDRITAGSEGEFCIRLFYNGRTYTTLFDILNNEFDHCNGQSSLYPLIRFFQGDNNNPKLDAPSTHVNLNYNKFKNKSMRPKDNDNDVNYNYVFYSNYCPEVTVDHRFNDFDNSEYAIGLVATPWNSNLERYFASSSTLMEFAKSKGCEFDYYKDALKNEIKAIDLAKATTVAQSFDVDDTNGDIYFVQIYGSSSVTLTNKDKTTRTCKLTAKEPLVITRRYKNADGELAHSYMYLDHAGHGSNMAMITIDGVHYILTGGNSVDTTYVKDGTTVNKTKSRATCIFPYRGSSFADLSKKTYTDYEKLERPITHFVNEWGRPWQYPAIDPVNRLFAERSTAGNYVYVTVYDLDDVLQNGSDAVKITTVPIKKGSNKTTSSEGNYQEVDNGFQTWDAQGFTIAGDYLYMLEGVGKANNKAAKKDGSAIPTIVMHVVNWRTGEFVYRKPIMRSTILNLTHGEPEGVKVHRDSKGRPHLLVGIASGASGARKANIFDFYLDTTTGLLYDTYSNEYHYHQPITTPDVENVTMQVYGNASGTASTTTTISLSHSHLRGYPTFEISGPGAHCFSIVDVRTASSQQSLAPQRRSSMVENGTFTDLPSTVDYPTEIEIEYHPSGSYEGGHNATLTISSPGAEDQNIALTGWYQSVVTGVGSVSADMKTPADNTVYTLQGVRVDGNHLAPGIYIRGGKKFIVR